MNPFKTGQCHYPNCNIPVLFREDQLPLCSQHEKLIIEDACRKVKKLQTLTNPKLYTKVVKSDN